jgi:hypothetical protein
MSTIEVRAPGMPVNQGNATGFQKGHPRYGGRRKGSRTALVVTCVNRLWPQSRRLALLRRMTKAI